MYQIEGRKKWTIWREEEIPLLDPVWKDKYDPIFPKVEDIIHAGHPLSFVLEPGTLLFVPGGSPHAVYNLDVTVALAGNFVGASNLEKVLHDLEKTSTRYPDDAELYQALSEMEFEEDEEVTYPLTMIYEVQS
eukprot:TRINITY_DN3074_c0_g1_i1.p1 TRINITY_DN3074_c0_g1~~TRINITY_DN3074_c0_g1_i1.p1  ORF type:complete len:146 (-),score=40.07 TRINITY_DN3074_c0_g1_i1:183-581(-)